MTRQEREVQRKLKILRHAEKAASSATTGEPQDLPVDMSDGRVNVSCTPPAAPANVTATQGQPDAVVVSWTAAPVTGATYRVYRSLTNDSSTAVALGQTAIAGETIIADFSPQAVPPMVRTV